MPQATVFDFATPADVDSGEGDALELGMKFRADYSGSITGIRFYKSAANTGTHTGSLWSTSGTRLAQATFTGETDSGWQSVTFSSPVAVTAGTTYVASYFAPQGHYSSSSHGLDDAVDNGPLHTIANSASGNGVYAYGTTSTFPSNSYQGTNYWVDVLYAVPAPGQVTGVTAGSGGATSANVSWSAPASGGPVTSYTITPYIGSVAQPATTISGTPPATEKKITGLTTGTTYTFTVRAANSNGSGLASAQSNPVTPAAAVVPAKPTDVTARPASKSALVSWTTPTSDGDSPITGYTVTPYIGANAQTPVDVGASATSKTITGLQNGTAYTFRVKATNAIGSSAASDASAAVTPEFTILDFASPTTTDAGDGSAVTLGVKFRADSAGTATGVRFYKASANTGTHVGALWTAGGTQLASATFTNETASGWQHVVFTTPVALTAGTTYVVSYLAPNGHYSVTGGGFSSGADNPPLHALSNAVSPNGVYSYGGTSTLPHELVQRRRLLGRRPVRPGSGARRANGRQRHRGFGVGTGVMDRTVQRRGSGLLRGDALHRLDRADVHDGLRHAAGHHQEHHGAHRRYLVHVPGAGGEPRRRRAGFRGFERGDADRRRHAVGTDRSHGSRRLEVRGGELDGAGQRRRQHDHGLHGDPVRGRDGAVADDRRARSTTKTRITGLTNGTSYTFRIAATSGAGTGPQSGASNAVSPKASLLELDTPSTVDAGDTSATVVGVKFTPDVDGTVTGVRFYKAAANTGTHVGALWSAAGSELRSGTLQRRDGLGLADPHVLHAGDGHRRDDLRRHLPRAERALLRHRRGLRRRAARQSAAARTRQRHELERRLRVQLDLRVPVQHVERHQLLGGRPVRPEQLERGTCARSASSPS